MGQFQARALFRRNPAEQAEIFVNTWRPVETHSTELDQLSLTPALATVVESDSVGRHQVHHLRDGISPQESNDLGVQRRAQRVRCSALLDAPRRCTLGVELHGSVCVTELNEFRDVDGEVGRD